MRALFTEAALRVRLNAKAARAELTINTAEMPIRAFTLAFEFV